MTRSCFLQLALLLTACTTDYAPERLNIGERSETGDCNPLSTQPSVVMRYIGAPLIRRDSYLVDHPDVADSVVFSGDGIRIEVAQDRTFTDGQPITAEDVLASVSAYATSDSSADKAVYDLAGFHGAAIVDGAVQVSLTHTYFPLLETMKDELVWPAALMGRAVELPTGSPIPCEEVVGAGRYRMGRYLPQRFIDFDPVLGGPPLRARILGFDASLLAFDRQQLDIFYAEPLQQVVVETGRHDHTVAVNILRYPVHDAISLTWDLDGIGANPRVREAVFSVIEPETYWRLVTPAGERKDGARAVDTSSSEAAAGRLFVGTMASNNASVRRERMRLEEARHALDEAGYPVGRDGRRGLVLRVVADPNFQEYEKILPRLKDDLETLLGVTVDVQMIDRLVSHLYRADGSVQYDLLLSEWPYKLNDASASLATSVTTHALPPQGANFANLRDPSIDALAWIADTDPDSGRRRAAFQGIHEQLIDSAVVLPIYFVKDGLVLSERVGGYSADDPNIRVTVHRWTDSLTLVR